MACSSAFVRPLTAQPEQAKLAAKKPGENRAERHQNADSLHNAARRAQTPAAGPTVEGLRQEMTRGLAKFFTDPQLDIRAVHSKQTRHLF